MPPAELGVLSAAALSPDGTRVALASALPASTRPVVLAPASSFARAVKAPLEVPGAKKATDGKGGKGGGDGHGKNGSDGRSGTCPRLWN